jgi:hypothetical protein
MKYPGGRRRDPEPDQHHLRAGPRSFTSRSPGASWRPGAGDADPDGTEPTAAALSRGPCSTDRTARAAAICLGWEDLLGDDPAPAAARRRGAYRRRAPTACLRAVDRPLRHRWPAPERVRGQRRAVDYSGPSGCARRAGRRARRTGHGAPLRAGPRPARS